MSPGFITFFHPEDNRNWRIILKRSRLLAGLLTICLVGAYLYLIPDYLKQNALQAVLASQISDTNRMLGLMPKPAADLEKRLADAKQANLNARQTVVPGKTNTTQIIDDVFQVADKVQLKITPLATNPWTEKKVEENTFRILRVELKAEGGYSGLLTFIQMLEDKNTFPSLAIERLAINRSGVLNENSTQEKQPEISANITITIFTLVPGGQ